MNKQDEESKEETPTLRKNKSRGGGKRGKAAQDNNAEQSRKSNNLDHIQAKVCPFDHAAVMDTLNADSQAGLLSPAIDDLLLENVTDFLLPPIRK